MELNLSEPGQSRYLRVYEYYKELIVSGQMKPGAKLPSIRKCSLQLQLSRTTVETAYMLLAADGYIISRPQSGFYVTDAVLAAANREEIEHGVPHQEERPEIRYDLRLQMWIGRASSLIYGGAMSRAPCARMSGCFLMANRRESGNSGRRSVRIWGATAM